MPPRSNVIVSTSGLEPQVSSKVLEDDRTLSKEDEITASIKAGNASISIASESSTKTIKPKRKSVGTKVVQPDSEAKSDSSSQKRKAFKPKQGNHLFGINILIHFAIIIVTGILLTSLHPHNTVHSLRSNSMLSGRQRCQQYSGHYDYN